MDVGLTFLVAGVAAIAASATFRSLFVNRGDEENPYRRLVSALGLAGFAAAIWGGVLLLTPSA